MIATLLAWTGLPTWLSEMLVILVLAGGSALGVHLWERSLIRDGIVQQQQADDKALQQFKAAADKITQQLRERAEAAEKAYAQERADSIDYQAQHPITTADQLCHPYGGNGHLPPSTGSHAGDARPGPATEPIQHLPPGDPSVSRDRLQMLSVLAARADSMSAQLRLWQTR